MLQNYASRLENKLISEFKTKFFDKLGYEPIVITRLNGQNGNDVLPISSLEELEECFEPFLPDNFGKILRLQTKCRKRDIVELRSIFCALARMMGHTHTDIGKFLGGRDHTTVIHNVRTFQDLITTDDRFQEKYKKILSSIKPTNESSDLEQLDQTLFEPEPALLP